MTVAAAAQADSSQASFAQTITLAGRAVQALEALLAEATDAVRARVSVAGKISSERIEADQHAVHGLAWLATYVTGLREMVRWAERLAEAGRLGETEALLLAVGVGEYLAQVFGGIPMSQNEIVRLTALGLDERAIAARRTDAVAALIATGNTPENRARLVELMRDKE